MSDWIIGTATTPLQIFPKLAAEILSDYKLQDIWNLDKTGLFYRTLPTQSLVNKSRKGRNLAEIWQKARKKQGGSQLHRERIGH